MTHDPTTFVFGIHHFCDHRCWRCALAPRCAVHTRWAETGRTSTWREPAGRVAGGRHIQSFETEMERDQLADVGLVLDDQGAAARRGGTRGIAVRHGAYYELYPAGL